MNEPRIFFTSDTHFGDPNVIRIRPFNAEVAQANCIHCHEGMVSQIHGALPGEDRPCTDCHTNPGHGR